MSGPAPETSPFRHVDPTDSSTPDEVPNSTPIEVNRDSARECSGSEADAPSLESMLSKVPASNRELLDELFRGKFIGVRKIDESELR
ncbi:MAG: hypothetical protein DRP71_03795 [Verrucomicrobia bacterium]|nr:MAG: hypothetical protein DRP71_03795 [Verrucomicrobiota bacterium]